jgi:hypothetical protein
VHGYLITAIWTIICLICYFSFQPSATHQTQQTDLSRWITLASEQINETRELTRHLANNYQTVELLADPADLNHHLSKHWLELIRNTPFIERIGVMEYQRGEVFYVSNPRFMSQQEGDWASQQQVNTDKSIDDMVNYWMQAQLITRNDVLFNSFFRDQQQTSDNGFFRFTAPVYYNDLRLGLVYLDLNLAELMNYVSNDLTTASNTDLIMLNKEGYFLAQTRDESVASLAESNKQHFEESIGYYYPEFWRTMNAGLSGHFQTASDSAYFSKLDIPWYEDQIEYFYILQISDRPAVERSNTYQKILIILWIIGSLLILVAAIRKRKNEYKQAM